MVYNHYKLIAFVLSRCYQGKKYNKVSIYHFLKLHDTNALRERRIRRMKVKILTYKHNNRIKELEEVISGLNIKNEEIKGDLK